MVSDDDDDDDGSWSLEKVAEEDLTFSVMYFKP